MPPPDNKPGPGASRSLSADRADELQKLLEDLGHQISSLVARLGDAEKGLTEQRGRTEQILNQLKAVAAHNERAAADMQALDARLDKNERAFAEVASAFGFATDAGPVKQQPAPRPIVSMVDEIREEAAKLFVRQAAGGSDLVVESLDVELRGDLVLDEQVGIRSFLPGRAGPEAASTIRFSLRPALRIMTPDEKHT